MLTFFLLSAPRASALRQPSTSAELTELAAIDALMVKEKNEYVQTRERLDFAIQRETGLGGDKRILDKLNGQMAALDSKHSSVMNEIVQRTVKLFDIQPSPNNGHLMTGPLKDRRVRWTPVYAPEVPSKRVILSNGKEAYLKVEGSFDGVTWADGSVEVNEKAFLSPGYLGAILYHESIHFEQLTSSARAGQSAVRAEIEAHSKSTSKRAAAVFALTAGEETRIKDAFTGQMEIFRKNPGMTATSMQFASGEELLREKMREAKELAAKQKVAQELKRQEEHDQRLMETMINLTRRSCDNPGSVSQAELSALRFPFNKDFKRITPLQPQDFPGREHCLKVYEHLAYANRDAEGLKALATPNRPAMVVPIFVPPAQEVAQPKETKLPFSRVLPQYKSYAVNACSAPQQIRSEMFLIQAYDHSYREYDDNLIREMKNGMSNCASQLFDYLIANKRRHNIDALQPDAVRAAVSSYTPVYSSPERGSPRQSEPGCEYDPNLGGTVCPKSL